MVVIRRRIQRDVGHVNNTLAERAEQMRLKLAQESSGQTLQRLGKNRWPKGRDNEDLWMHRKLIGGVND